MRTDFLDLFKKLDNVERSNIKLIAKACSKHNSDKWRVLDKSLHETPVVDVVSTFNYKYIRYIADDSENTRDCNTPTRTDRNAFSVMMESECTYYSEFNFCRSCCGTVQCFNHNLLPDMHIFLIKLIKIMLKIFFCPTYRYPNFFGHVIGNKDLKFLASLTPFKKCYNYFFNDPVIFTLICLSIGLCYCVVCCIVVFCKYACFILVIYHVCYGLIIIKVNKCQVYQEAIKITIFEKGYPRVIVHLLYCQCLFQCHYLTHVIGGIKAKYFITVNGALQIEFIQWDQCALLQFISSI